MPRRAAGCVFVATSLDGFIARRDGDISWLDAGGGSDCGYVQSRYRVMSRS